MSVEGNGRGFYKGGEMGSEHEFGERLHLKLARELQHPISSLGKVEGDRDGVFDLDKTSTSLIS